MAVDLSKINSRLVWQTVIIVVGLILLVAEVIVLVVFMAGRLTPVNSPSPTEEIVSSTKPDIVVPEVCPAKLNAFTPEDFSYDGDYLACTARPYELGVDVSSYQGEIDWEQVRSAGFTFAIIRVGGRGYGSEGRLYADETAQQNYVGAKAAGLKVGCYFFSQAISEREAREEAKYALELIEGWELDLPLVYDWEFISDEARTGSMEESDKIRFTTAFFRVVEAAGVEPMAYVAPWASVDYMLAVEHHPVWLVLYSDQMTFPYHFDYWQYCVDGEVPGIKGKVDINIYIPPQED